jgi:hypothetical protein
MNAKSECGNERMNVERRTGLFGMMRFNEACIADLIYELSLMRFSARVLAIILPSGRVDTWVPASPVHCFPENRM